MRTEKHTMKIKYFIVAVTIATSAFALDAGSQTTYTEGLITYTTIINGMDVPSQEYFTPDSVASELNAGPAAIRTLSDAQFKFFAVMVDVSAFNIKKAAIYTPDEIAQVINVYPALTFAPTTETKQISGFNCTKVVATDANTQQTYEVWITNDITVPVCAIPQYYKTAGGFPVLYTAFAKGADGNLATTTVTVNNISNQRPPAGKFSIPSDFDKISKADLEAMSESGNK